MDIIISADHNSAWYPNIQDKYLLCALYASAITYFMCLAASYQKLFCTLSKRMKALFVAYSALVLSLLLCFVIAMTVPMEESLQRSFRHVLMVGIVGASGIVYWLCVFQFKLIHVSMNTLNEEPQQVLRRCDKLNRMVGLGVFVLGSNFMVLIAYNTFWVQSNAIGTVCDVMVFCFRWFCVFINIQIARLALSFITILENEDGSVRQKRAKSVVLGFTAFLLMEDISAITCQIMMFFNFLGVVNLSASFFFKVCLAFEIFFYFIRVMAQGLFIIGALVYIFNNVKSIEKKQSQPDPLESEQSINLLVQSKEMGKGDSREIEEEQNWRSTANFLRADSKLRIIQRHQRDMLGDIGQPNKQKKAQQNLASFIKFDMMTGGLNDTSGVQPNDNYEHHRNQNVDARPLSASTQFSRNEIQEAIDDQSGDKFRQLNKETVRKNALLKQMDGQTHFYLRLSAVSVILTAFIFGGRGLHQPVLGPGECLRDNLFVWTESVNSFFMGDIKLKNQYMIISGLLMDFCQMAGIFLFLVQYKTSRAVFAFALFMLPRAWIQAHYLMGRQHGFLWYDPGIPALTVPYHDTNDFFYSGHIGTSMIYLYEFFVHGTTVMAVIACVNFFNCWFLMVFLRTHYVIDLITGLIVSLWAMKIAEKLSWLLDVKVAGWDGKSRKQIQNTPCHKCGWSNERVDCMIGEDEKNFLQETHRMRNGDDKSDCQYMSKPSLKSSLGALSEKDLLYEESKRLL